MDLPLTNDLTYFNQEEPKKTRNRPCLLCFCTLTTVVAGLLLMDVVVKDRQGSKSKLLLLEEEMFPPEKAVSHSEGPPVVPEYTEVFSEDFFEDIWDENILNQINGDASHGTDAELSFGRSELPASSAGAYVGRSEAVAEGMSLQQEGDSAPGSGAVSESDTERGLDESTNEDAELEIYSGVFASEPAVPDMMKYERIDQETAPTTGLDVLDGGVNVHEESMDLQAERSAQFENFESLMAEEVDAPEEKADSGSDETEAPATAWDTGTERVSAASISGGSHTEQPAIGAENSQPLLQASELVAKEVGAVKTGAFAALRDFGKKTSSRELQSCYDIARSTSEPYTQEYRPHKEQVSISGTVWADYNWPGVITRESITYAQASGIYKSFKIINGRLYGATSNHDLLSSEEDKKLDSFVKSVLLAIGLFDVPDVEFIVDLGDHQRASASPALHFAFDLSLDNPMGFTVPSVAAIEGALGPIQLRSLFECLDKRYPGVDRPMTVVVNSANTSGQSQLLIEEGRSHQESLNYKVCSLGDCDELAFDAAPFAPKKPPSQAEDLNHFAFVVDLDEDNHSTEFSDLLKQDTPVLKQETRFPGYFWSHVLEDKPVQIFRKDGSDLFETLNNAAGLRNMSPSFYHRMAVDKMRDFSQTHLSHVGVARATAYALTVYASKIQWIPRLEDGYAEISSDAPLMDTLPEAFIHQPVA